MATSTSTVSKSDTTTKDSCADLQSRLKIRKVLGVGDTARSKISQLLGQSDDLIFRLPPKISLWLCMTTLFFIGFTILGFLSPTYLRLFLPGQYESSLHLSSSYAFLAAILGLTLRSGDKTSLRLVLLSLVLFHTVSCFIAIWLLSNNKTIIKSTISFVLHLSCGIVNAHFYRSVIRTVSSTGSNSKIKLRFPSLRSFSSTSDPHEDSTFQDK